MKAEVSKDGYVWMQEYKIGKPLAQVKKLEKTKATGTKITFLADKTIFKEIKYDEKKIINHLRRQAYLETNPQNFSRIVHDYSDNNKGFIIWKGQLEERLS
jgi:DNA gyrase/topoisomerase IV subunit B